LVLDGAWVPDHHAVGLRPASLGLQREAQGIAWYFSLVATVYDGAARSARDWLGDFLNQRRPSALGGANLASILLTTLLLTSQHLLYGLSMRPVLSNQPLRWRLGLGFLLTDEFFALTSQYDQQQFNRWYALGVGLTFYVAWNLFTLAGILLGQSIPHLDQYGLDFSIVATFVALIAPLVRNLATLACVAVSLFCSVLFSYWHWETALVAAGLLGMSAGFICQKFAGART